MAAATSPAGRRPRLADRLAAARRRRFVGREAELALFAAALADPEPPFALLYVHGPGGVGKTLLLSEFARLADDAGVPAVRLDGRDLDPSPPGFLAALGRALDEPPDTSPLEALTRRPRGVLMVDTYETLGPLDAWLREALLPELPGGHLVVLAGRDPPAAGWLADAGWRDLARVVPLRNLRPEESLAYLSARGVPATQHAAVLSFTHGHPLALSLVADVAATGGDPTALAPEQRPDVVRALLGRFVQQLPGARHRQALEACAHVRVTTEALLASALDADDAHELFGWLRRLSFVEEGPYGLFPHDLAREVLDADLRWPPRGGGLGPDRRALVAAPARGLRGVPDRRRGAGRLHRRPGPAPGRPGRPGGRPGRGRGPPLRRPARPCPPR
jgi:AAA ATPase domain